MSKRADWEGRELSKQEKIEIFTNFVAVIDREFLEIEKSYVKEDPVERFKKNSEVMVGSYDYDLKKFYSGGIINNEPTNVCYYANNLFSAVGVCLINGQYKSMEAGSKTFKSEKELQKFIKKYRPLVFTKSKIKAITRRTTTFTREDIEKEITQEDLEDRFILRYFDTIGKLPRWKFWLSNLYGKFNIKYFRPLVYRIVATN